LFEEYFKKMEWGGYVTRRGKSGLRRDEVLKQALEK
jgi:hypothetical protein